MQLAPTLREHQAIIDEHSMSVPGFAPVLVREIDLSGPLPTLCAVHAQKPQVYGSVRCLVRLHTQPVGLIDFTFGSRHELSPEEYAPLIWQALAKHINNHLCSDGLAEATALEAGGLPDLHVPKCIEAREAFLQRAPLASVVISTRDRPDRLARCLPPLLAMRYPNFEIIVVDNAPSTSATADFIQQTYATEPMVRYVREDRPGLSAGRNRGIQEARGEIIAITDDDVTVDTYWLAGLAQGFEAAENVACVTSLLLPLELETPAQVWLEEFGGFNKGFVRRVFDLKHGKEDTPLHPFTAGRFGTGGGLALTAQYLRQEGGFDPALGNGTRSGGGEDLAAFFQVIARGYRLVYEPGSLVYHEHHRDYAKLKKQMYYYGSSLTAYLTKIVIDNPSLLLSIIARIPHGFKLIFSSKSEKNRKKSGQFPQELTRLERKGMLRGPSFYIKGRRANKRSSFSRPGAPAARKT